MQRTPRSISTPITLTSVAVALSIALLVGWTVLIADLAGTPGTTWYLVLGILSIGFIMAVLLVSGVTLAREILEGRRQRAFIDSVTHELKSPLASIGLCLETLGRADLPTTTAHELREMMRHDVLRLSAFIDDVLAASRLAHRRAAHALAPTSLRELVANAVAKVRSRHEASADAVEIDVPEDMVVVTDATVVETIVKNLVDNAIKYSDDPPHVRVAAVRNEAGALVVAVTDQGIGIHPRDLPLVFRRFYRGDAPEVRARSGTGLGLFVASEMAKGLGGRIWAQSAGRGRGTTVTLTLPATHLHGGNA